MSLWRSRMSGLPNVQYDGNVRVFGRAPAPLGHYRTFSSAATSPMFFARCVLPDVFADRSARSMPRVATVRSGCIMRPISPCPPVRCARRACTRAKHVSLSTSRLLITSPDRKGNMARHQLALDIGGTFTDVVMVDGVSGALWTAKVPSTPRDPADGFFDGVEKILRLAAAAPADVAAVFHGSTIATNAVLEGKGARTGMLVTAGFRYVLEIGRHEIPRKENLFVWRKPKRPVPPRLIVEVPERLLLDGRVERMLDETACREAARRLRALGVEAVAIVFLHSYANPAHERRAAEIVAEEFPEAVISLSCDVLPVFREYERSMATALNACVQRLVGSYIGRLQTGLAKRKVAAPLLVMKSNGGVFGPRQADRQAINMALSGPAAGVIGASFVARAAGCDNSVTID